MSNHPAPARASLLSLLRHPFRPPLLRPSLLVAFVAAAVGCAGGEMDGSLDPEGIDLPPPPPPASDRNVDGVDGDEDVPQARDTGSSVSNDDDASAPSAAPVPNGWLYTDGNRILRAGGSRWQGRGANIADMRGCNACGPGFQDPDEVKRRIDVLVDEWGADFLRLTLESSGQSGILHDPTYLAQLEEVVDYIGTKPGVVVMVANWISPHHSEMGWPTDGTREEWRALAARFADDKHVMFGLVNEPESNHDGALDAQVWQAMNETVAAIREVEAELDAPKHLIAVQGTGGWARLLDYYVDHPITAGGGENIVYEVHVYDGAALFEERFIEPAKTLPVVIGEFGPWEPHMNLSDTAELIRQADAQEVPWLAWTFHMRCPPNLIEDHSAGGCGIDMPIVATPWGEQIKAALAK